MTAGDARSLTKPEGRSICLFCGSSDAADPAFLEAASALGTAMAVAGVRLVYGGGGIGLMGAAARAAHEAGGKVLGIMPAFLGSREVLFDAVETVVTANMHDRKQIMFEQSDAFVVAPGGIGTLEEVVELISWRRLDLHAKPIVFLNPRNFWAPFFALIDHPIAENLTPAWTTDAWGVADRVEDVLPLVEQLMASSRAHDGEVSAKS